MRTFDLGTGNKTPQQAFYLQGVGAGGGSGRLTRLIDRIGGGAIASL